MNSTDPFDQLLRTAGEQRSAFPEQALTAFWPMCGHNWKRELMVVGRAVNGWTDDWSPVRAVDLAGRLEIRAMTLRASQGDGSGCPMLWVSMSWGARVGYNTKRSAFWRVIRRAVSDLGICDPDLPAWPSSLTWTNLYKLSPAAGGNPSGALIRLQHDLCVELLRHEIVEYQPARMLFLTGMDWAAPFLSAIGDFAPRWRGSGSVQAAGAMKIRGLPSAAAVVVAQHPQGKGDGTYVEPFRDAWAALA